jgi:hypothetical protein
MTGATADFATKPISRYSFAWRTASAPLWTVIILHLPSLGVSRPNSIVQLTACFPSILSPPKPSTRQPYHQSWPDYLSVAIYAARSAASVRDSPISSPRAASKEATKVSDIRAAGGALKLGKKEADERMERSLYQRGLGYSYDAVKIFMPAEADLRAVRRARAAGHDGGDLLAEEPRPGALARRLAARARHRQVHHLGQADDRGAVDQRTCDRPRGDRGAGAAARGQIEVSVVARFLDWLYR